MKGTVVEISSDRVREGFRLLKDLRGDIEVQAFGDRLNVVVGDADRDIPQARRILTDAGIHISALRVVPPTLENVFISMLTHTEGVA